MPLTIANAMPRKNYGETSFGERLQAVRKARGLTQVQLAEAAGTTQRAISYYETEAGFPPAPASSTSPKLCGSRPTNCSASRLRRSNASTTTAKRGGCGRDSGWSRPCRKGTGRPSSVSFTLWSPPAPPEGMQVTPSAEVKLTMKSKDEDGARAAPPVIASVRRLFQAGTFKLGLPCSDLVKPEDGIVPFARERKYSLFVLEHQGR